MKVHSLTTEVWLPCPRDQVFAFFGNVDNLDVLTPPWLHFRIVTPDVVIQQSSLIDYRLRWHGVPLTWRTVIQVWEPPGRFIDCQLQGPYQQWIHEHIFEERDGGTLCRDRVDYALPGWLLEPLLHRFLVGPDLAAIFAYRKEKLQQLFPG